MSDGVGSYAPLVGVGAALSIVVLLAAPAIAASIAPGSPALLENGVNRSVPTALPSTGPSDFVAHRGTVAAPTNAQSAPAAGTSYPVTFVQYGLPFGATWYVNISGQPSLNATAGLSSGYEVATNLTNGTYFFNASTSQPYYEATGGHTFNVSGAAVGEGIIYAIEPGYFQVGFVEQGIPGGTTWSATFNGTAQSAYAPNIIVFYALNGTYRFSIGTVAGYTSNLTSGNVTLHGYTLTYYVGFTGSSGPVPPPMSTFPWTWLLGGLIAGALVVFVILLATRRRTEPEEGVADEGPSGPPPGSAGDPP